MFKKLFLIACVLTFAAMTSIGYSATVPSDDYIIPIDNQGKLPGDVNLVGVDAHTITNTTTGAIVKNPSVTTLVSTTTNNPCLLYGVVFSTSYAFGTDYIVIRDTSVVNTTTVPTFTIMVSSMTAATGTSSAQTTKFMFQEPVKFYYGICATASGSTFVTNVLFRYLTR